ncbi:MAG: hypothetical protein K9K88_01875 [Desulfobacterales bacterium]|nr:hypothetical protein [Desulfobacterales bacterium]
MNGITQAFFFLTLWLVMGIGFLSKATELRRQGKSWADALTSIEALLFYLSLLAPFVLVIQRNVPL